MAAKIGRIDLSRPFDDALPLMGRNLLVVAQAGCIKHKVAVGGKE
ncbi:MAG: hypothetical protein ACKVK8_00010 [Rhodospirillales bacterium]|jgi:hypothetical protein